MSKTNDETVRIRLTPSQVAWGIRLAESGYRLENQEVNGYLIRTSVSRDTDEVFFAEPIEARHRYIGITTPDGEEFIVHGHIRGDVLIARGTLTEVDGQMGGRDSQETLE